MSMTVLDLDNWAAQGATAELMSKKLGVRLAFKLNEAPSIKVISSIGRGKESRMTPTVLVLEYTKTNDDEWCVSVLRVYGRDVSDGSSALNIYPHEDLSDSRIPAWIRDAAIKGMP